MTSHKKLTAFDIFWMIAVAIFYATALAGAVAYFIYMLFTGENVEG